MASTFDIASQNNMGVLNGTSYGPSISADGTRAAFISFDTVSGFDQVYLKNFQNSVLTLISVSTGGGTAGNNTSYYPAISADGSTVGFDSYATNLVAAPTGGNDEVYVKNVSTGGLTLVSQTAGGTVADGQSEYAALSANGNLVAFDSSATDLGLGATGASKEIYVKNVATGGLTLASQTATGTQANGTSYSQSISADGNVVVFRSSATDLGSGTGTTEIYAKNLSTAALSIVSSKSDGTIANAGSYDGSTSADGTLVGFDSTASNLFAGATGGNYEAYLKNLTSGALTLISSKADGTIANGTSDEPIISADGHYALFESTATNLDPAATTGTEQVYVKNLQTGALTLLSKDASGVAGNATSSISYPSEQAFSADDSRIVFETKATNLGGSAATAVIVRDTTTAPTVSFKPVTSDNILNTTELAAPVTFSGTSDAIGGTVQVSIDTAGNSIGTAPVLADGTWSLAASVAGLAQGAHTEIATAQGSNYLTTTTSQGFSVDTTAPTVAFTPGVTFTNPSTATLTGTVSDPLSTVTGVEVFNAGAPLGAATLNGDGTWTLPNAHLPRGVQSLTATATDAVGNTSAQTPSSYYLQTGIHGQPYTSYEEDLDNSGNFAGEIYTKAHGAVYLADTVVPRTDSDKQIDTYAGTFFDTQNYFYKSDVFSSDYSVFKSETLYNNDGTHSVTGFVNNLILDSVHDDTLTGGGKHETFLFQPHFGQDTITDFIAGGPKHDTISLASSQFSSAAQVLNHTQDVNGNAVIHVGAHNSITLDGVSKTSLHANDFTFHA